VIVTIISLGIIQVVKSVQFEKNQIELKTIQIQNVKSDLKLLQTKYDILNSGIEEAKNDKKKIEVLEKEKVELDTERKRLETELHAKLERKEQERLAEEKRSKSIANIIVPIKSVSATSGVMIGCSDLMKQAGITDPVAHEIINRENRSCDPCVYNNGTPAGGRDCNYQGGRAYGIPQSLPGSKMASEGADWRTNPVTQLRWMQKYVIGRYGSWSAALQHHDNNNWY
jgi:hypothetical protein